MPIPDDVVLKVPFYLKREKNGVSGYLFLPYVDSTHKKYLLFKKPVRFVFGI